MRQGTAVTGIEGTYRLVSCEVLWSDGEIGFPYGEDADGLLVYTANGFVTGHLMRQDVPKFRTGARRVPPEQAREAFLGYLGYYGTYEVDVAIGTVTHHVLGGWHPNWIGHGPSPALPLQGRAIGDRNSCCQLGRSFPPNTSRLAEGRGHVGEIQPGRDYTIDRRRLPVAGDRFSGPAESEWEPDGSDLH